MNDSIKKAFNALFRAALICCFIMSVVMIYKFFSIYGESITSENEHITMTKELISLMASYSSLYKGLFFTGIAAVVLSILCNKYKASAAAVFFRTVLIACTVAIMSNGVDACSALIEVNTVIENIDEDYLESVEDLKDLDQEVLTDAGLTEEGADEISDALKDESAVIAFASAPFLCSFVYFILACTSLHNLLKKTPQGANCGGCEDARRVEMYDPSMLNGGNHYAQPQQQFINPMAMNRMNAVPPVARNPYVQNIINQANAAHPAHDHHDSAAVHDLEAEGEFHDYARAEADMTDDSSDYLSQLQREENRGHRVTDEDFM